MKPISLFQGPVATCLLKSVGGGGRSNHTDMRLAQSVGLKFLPGRWQRLTQSLEEV